MRSRRVSTLRLRRRSSGLEINRANRRLQPDSDFDEVAAGQNSLFLVKAIIFAETRIRQIPAGGSVFYLVTFFWRRDKHMWEAWCI